MRQHGDSLVRLLLTLWVGGLWVTGYCVVPVLFSSLERTVAGAIAGKLFELMAWLGLAVAALILVLAGVVRDARHGREPVVWLLLSMAALAALQLFFFQPEIARLKALALDSLQEFGPGSAIFARWHAAVSLCYLLQSLLGVGLVLWSERLFRR